MLKKLPHVDAERAKRAECALKQCFTISKTQESLHTLTDTHNHTQKAYPASASQLQMVSRFPFTY